MFGIYFVKCSRLITKRSQLYTYSRHTPATRKTRCLIFVLYFLQNNYRSGFNRKNGGTKVRRFWFPLTFRRWPNKCIIVLYHVYCGHGTDLTCEIGTNGPRVKRSKLLFSFSINRLTHTTIDKKKNK